jgi:PAS domain S-box-containing protein
MTVLSQEFPLGTALHRSWLSRRLMAAVAVVVVAGTALGAAAILSRVASRRAEMERSGLAVARGAMVALDREVAAAVARLQGLASSPALQGEDLRPFYDQLRRVAKPPGTWFILLRGREQILNTLLPFETTSFPASHEYAAGYERSIQLLATGTPFVVRPVTWSPLQKRFVTGIGIRAPRSSDTIYILWTAIPNANLSEILRTIRTEGTGPGSVLVSLEGEVVASADGRMASGQPRPDGWPMPTGREMEGLLQSSVIGDVMTVAYARSSSVPWVMYVPVPLSKLTAAGNRAAGVLLACALVTLALGLVAARWTSKHVERPFTALREFAEHAGLSRRETENRYRVFWDNTGDGLFVARRGESSGFVIETSNPAYLELACRTADDVSGSRVWDDIPEPGRSAVEQQFAECERSGRAARFDCIVRVGGFDRFWEINLAPLRDAATGHVDRLLGCVRDVTGSRRRKEALRRLSGRILTVQDEERRRIARELHDSTGQALLGASLALAQSMPKLPPTSEARPYLEDASALIDLTQRELRSLSYLLHPPLLDELGLPKALGEYIAGFAARSGVEVCFDLDPEMQDLRFPPEVGIALFRVAQEALGNARRHSQCTRIEVGLRRCEPGGRRSSQAELVISDNGHGMVLHEGCAEHKSSGVGIASMRERMNQIGGSLMLGRARAGGLELRAAFELAAVG